MKVLVAMSGGLKSLVTAWLLKKQGMQVRGVYLDFLGQSKSQSLVEALERKLGISIQVIQVHQEFIAFRDEARVRSMDRGEILDLELFFHQEMLFPKLLELKEQHQFDRVATGHRVLVHEDQVSKTFRVYQNSDGQFNDAFFILGRSQKDLASLLLPLGSIPSNMFDKLANELGSDITWKNEVVEAENLLLNVYEVITPEGNTVGNYQSPPTPRAGLSYSPAEKTEQPYVMTEVSFLSNQILAMHPRDLKIEEVLLKQAAWFSRADLGLEHLSCGITAQSQAKIIPVRLLQYEGGRVKAHLNQPLLGEEANIFKGQTVLWVEGIEILGGGRVLGTR